MFSPLDTDKTFGNLGTLIQEGINKAASDASRKEKISSTYRSDTISWATVRTLSLEPKTEDCFTKALKKKIKYLEKHK